MVQPHVDPQSPGRPHPVSTASFATARTGARGLVAALLVASQILYGLPVLAPLGEASAQMPPPRVWLGPLKSESVPGAGLLSEKFDESARDQLRRSQKVQLTDQQGMGRVAAGTADPRVAQAETLRVAGKEAFGKGDHQGALEKLRAALDLYEQALPSVNKLDAVLETLGYLGAVSLALKYDADAAEYFRRVVAMAPDAAALDEFAPETRAFFDEEREKLLKKKKGELKIETTPPGAEVRVDGVEQGTSPVTVKGLVRGSHYVQASHPEAGLAGQRVQAKSGKTESVSLTLATELGPEPIKPVDPALVTKLDGLAREGNLGHEFRDTSEAIAAQTRADYVVVGYIAPQGNNFVLTAYIYGVEQKQTAAFDQYSFRADISAAFVQATAFATAVEQYANKFPFDKVVVGGIVRAPVVVTPAPTPKPEPKPEPVAVVPAPRVLPERPEDLGLSTSTLDEVPQRKDEDDESWYEKWWVWTIVGAAVVGGTAYGGYVLLQDEPQSRTFDARVRW